MVCDEWNGLINQDVGVKLIGSFKTRLDKYIYKNDMLKWVGNFI